MDQRALSQVLALKDRSIGLHVDVESVIAARSNAGVVDPEDRIRYRECFYRVVRGWNLLGDNGALLCHRCVLVCLQRIVYFLHFLLLPMIRR